MRELQSLDHRHHRMVELALGGATNNEIARLMDMTASTVSIIMRSGLFQDALARRRKEQNAQHDQASAGTVLEAHTKANDLALNALDVHAKLLNSPDPKVAQLSATEILKRSLDRVYPTVGQAGVTQTFNLAPGALLQLQVALRESAELDGRKPAEGGQATGLPIDKLLEDFVEAHTAPPKVAEPAKDSLTKASNGMNDGTVEAA